MTGETTTLAARPPAAERPTPLRRVTSALHRVENGILVAVFMVSMVLPLIEALGRALGGFHIKGTAVYLQHAVLWLSFVGGLIATRERKHLQLSTVEAIPAGRWRTAAGVFANGVAATITAVLAYASFQVVKANREAGDVMPIGVPEWVSELVMPVALALISVRFVLRASDGWRGRLVALAILPVGFLLDLAPGFTEAWSLTLVGLVVFAALLGAPVFCAMAGAGMLLFYAEWTPVAAVSAEIYRLVSSPTLPAIPLLTGCGYLLAESRAAQRLVRFFKALFGWMPGGVAVLVASVCAVFTTFTGGSGVTIIALGGLAYGILRKDGYSEGFSLGLVTAAGSLGLLFPPSLPVILYSVVAGVPADKLYVAGLVPGLLLVLLVAGYGVWVGRKVEKERPPFDLKELLASAWEAKWELSVPLIVLALFLSGFASMVEASAAAVAYALVVECFITRDIHPIRDLPGIIAKAGVLIGAVLILLSAAMGLSGYLVEAEAAEHLLELVQSTISEPWVFLLVLNGLLLVLGSVLEIYSAIVILPPIIAPMAIHYGIDPVHLGIIFLANLELGYLFPPVGLNLFLTSSRFDKPMVQLYRMVIPYLLILGAGVLIITYFEPMSIGILELFEGGTSTDPPG